MSKINHILGEWQPGDVHTLKWFAARQVQQRTAYKYHETGALKKIGTGVFARPHDKLLWVGAVRTLQEELKLNLHVGSKAALELQGSAHYLQASKRPNIEVIVATKTSIPIWVKNNDWGVNFEFQRSSLISGSQELVPYEDKGITISISSREQAILEFLSTVDLSKSFETAENYLSGLLNLRPKVLQSLLERCNSVKVKRVFLFLSETMELPFFQKLDIEKINLGTGKRVIAKAGNLNHKYQITVPRQYGEAKNVF